jgi:hypothetical protein
MSFTVIVTDVFETWFRRQTKELQRRRLMHLELLAEYGPQLARPYADTLKGSNLKHLKELRVQYKQDPCRIIYAFDPKRQAVVLLGGNKAGDKQWYAKTIPQAEQLYQHHLTTLEDKSENAKDPG